MRLSSAISLAFVAACFARAETPDGISWSPGRLLTWEDFAGPVPAKADHGRVAETSASLGWSYEFEVIWSSHTCIFRISSIESAATFHPATSWVRPGYLTPAVLLHEQGHFDIVQLYKERFAESTRGLIGSDRRCGGSNERKSTRYAEREVARLVGAIYDDVWRKYRRQQEAYDEETRHGIDAKAQAEWTRRLAGSLRAADRK